MGDFTVKTLSLPAGSYVVHATAAFARTFSSTFSGVACTLRTGSGQFGDQDQSTVGGDFNSFALVPLAAAFTLAGPDTVSIICTAFTDGVFTQPSTITAIQVQTLSVQ